MNAYSYFYAHTEPLPASDRSQQAVKLGTLTEPQLEFLNSCACQHVNPYSKDFWSELLDLLSTESQQVKNIPKSPDYRYALEPYLLRRVHMTADRLLYIFLLVNFFLSGSRSHSRWTAPFCML